MTINGIAHAAKRFFDIGDGFGDRVSKEDNLMHLKDELVRQILALQCIERFMDLAKKSKVSVYSGSFAKSYLFLLD